MRLNGRISAIRTKHNATGTLTIFTGTTDTGGRSLEFRTSKTLAKKIGLRGTVDTFGASGAVRQHRLIRTCQWFGFAGIASFRRY